MQQPRLIIIAGCNGSGKSTYSQSLVKKSIKPFDYDLRFAEYYRELPDSEYREEFAKNKTSTELTKLVRYSFDNKTSFCFETNFVPTPINWISEAKTLGFKIEIFFFCLINLEMAKERVLTRVKNQGHYVEDSIVEYKWKEGYKNINKYYPLADRIVFIDNSENSIPSFLFELNKTKLNEFEIYLHNKLPEYLQRRLPTIFDLIDKDL